MDLSQILSATLRNYNSVTVDGKHVTLADHYASLRDNTSFGDVVKAVATSLVSQSGGTISEESMDSDDLLLQCAWFVVMNQEAAEFSAFSSGPPGESPVTIQKEALQGQATGELHVHSKALLQCFTFLLNQYEYPNPEQLLGEIAGLKFQGISEADLEIPARFR